MQDSTRTLVTYLSTYIEDWLPLTMSGNSTLTLEVLRLLHTAAETSVLVHQAALEAAVLPALLDLLRTLAEGRTGLHVDDPVTTCACDVLDWFLLSARLPHSASAEASPSTREVHVVLHPALTAQLAAQLTAVVAQSESAAVGAASLKCLYRMACMEDDPVPHVSAKQCGSICQNTSGSAQQGNVAAAPVCDVHSKEASSRRDQLSQHETPQNIGKVEEQQHLSVGEVQPHCLWPVLQSAPAVEGAVVVAATLASDGPSGSYWAHVVAVLAVLSWVAAALARGTDATQHSAAATAHPGTASLWRTLSHDHTCFVS